MSRVDLQRVKQIRQKNSSQDYLQPIPIGTDGLLVDMISNLDLEEELKLGGNHYVEIRSSVVNTNIFEWYFSEPKGIRTVEEMKQLGLITYSIEVIITNKRQNKIETERGNKEFIITQQEISANSDFIVTREEIIGEQAIMINLYEGDISEGKLLHQKVITIKEEASDLTTINEGVDE